VLARAIEEAGLPTTTIVLIREHAERVKPPRALFAPFPFGFALGNPDDPPFQHKVLAAALDLLKQPSGPVLAEFLEDGEAPAQILQASAARKDVSNASGDPADELTGVRGYYERWNGDHDGRTMVGLSGVPQRRFRGLVKYMQEFNPGEPSDFDEKPDGVATPRFLRLASDDLKSFYMEARMCQRPEQQNNDLQRWFWTETAMGTMLSDLAGRLAGSEEQPYQQAATGIAR
jgi:hypothetical protein